MPNKVEVNEVVQSNDGEKVNDGAKSNKGLYLDWGEPIETPEFNCRIQISPYNKRITVEEFDLKQNQDSAAEEMLKVLVKIASDNGLDKIWLKCKPQYLQPFLVNGMKLEASIPGYYNGKEEALVFALYLSKERETPSYPNNREMARKLVSKAKNKMDQQELQLPEGITVKWGQKQDCVPLAELYSKVFATYPFPIFDPSYLESTIEQNSTYYITLWHQNDLIAASSAEVNPALQNAEMTDFATLPDWRGHGLASFLLAEMENRLQGEGFRCLYTIARSSSTGMNTVFANSGYDYYGVLVNNCNIGEDFEDMNVWAKLI